jgi:hypothetical protein
MKSEFRRRTKVKPGGFVEVSVPELSDGESVEVVIRRENGTTPNGKRLGFGSARGLIKISDDFDAPLADFSDYQ